MKTDKTYESLMELGADSVTEIKKYIYLNFSLVIENIFIIGRSIKNTFKKV